MIQKLGRRKHWWVVQKPTQISLIAQIPQSDTVIIQRHGSHDGRQPRRRVFAVENR